jgi:hypothetical protein
MGEDKIAIIGKKDIHVAITNYIHNELHITRDDIIEVMKKKTEQILEHRIKELFDSKAFHELVGLKVMQFIKEGKKNNYFDRDSFEKFITSVVRERVEEMIFQRYEIEIKEKKES